MALELVGGAFLSSFFDHLLKKMESPELTDFFKGRELNIELLKKLKIAMITVSGLLDNAEEKQISVPAVKKWLDELKDAAYEADDLLDEIAYEELRSKLEAESVKHKARKFFSSHIPFEEGVNEKMQQILVLIEYLLKQMKSLGLTLRVGVGEKPPSQPTSSLLDDKYIDIRHSEKEAIIKALLSVTNVNGNGIEAISIEGLGGIGKTTIAQQVFNDSRVRAFFNTQRWVYVSEEFNVARITYDLLTEVGSWSLESEKLLLEVLENKIKDELKNQKPKPKASEEYDTSKKTNDHPTEDGPSPSEVEKLLLKVLQNKLKDQSSSESQKLVLDVLQNKLKDKLKDQKFLLVLDDVWTENQKTGKIY